MAKCSEAFVERARKKNTAAFLWGLGSRLSITSGEPYSVFNQGSVKRRKGRKSVVWS